MLGQTATDPSSREFVPAGEMVAIVQLPPARPTQDVNVAAPKLDW